MLEMVVAMVVLGIALAGLLPLAIQHSRQVKTLEGCNPQTGRWRCAEGIWTYGSDSLGQYPDQWYITPSSDAWAKKLCAAALLSSGTTSSPSIAPLPIYVNDSILNANTILADNSTSGYYGESDSNWLDGPAIGYLGNSRRHSAGTVGAAASSDYAAWTFQNVPPGWYVVEATWPDPSAGPFPQTAGVNQTATPSACFVLYDVTGNRQLLTATVDQSHAVTGDPYAGYNWQPIVTAYVPSHILDAGVTVATVQVRLMSQAQDVNGVAASGFTTADAVRLVTTGNTATVSALTRSFGTTTVSATTSVTTLTPRP